jgi:hypothetical protein
LWFDIPLRTGFVNITRNVDAHLKESGTREGLCLGKKKESVFLLGIFHFHRLFRLVQALPPENSKSRLELIPR